MLMPFQLNSDGNLPGIHCPISWSRYMLSRGEGLKLPSTCRPNLRSSNPLVWGWGILGTTLKFGTVVKAGKRGVTQMHKKGKN